jgi:hypothetical protein
VTLGVNWWNPAGSPAPSPAPRPETHRSRGPTRVVVASIIPRSDVRVVVAPKRLRVDPSPAVRIRTGARFGVGMTAIVLAATRSRSSSLAALDAAEAFLAALPSTELASLWILSLAPRPILVSDFRRLDRGGASHVRARLREVRDALEGRKPATETDPERATNLFATNVSSPTRATRTSALASTLDAAAPRGAASARARVRQGALASVLAEIARVRNDAEGPAAHDVVVVAPRRFDVGAANRAASDRVDATRGGGRWALSWLVRGGGDAVRLDAEAGPERGGASAVLTIRAGWSEGGARRLAATILERRENVVRVGVCPQSREAADADASASFAFSFEVPTTSEGGPSAAAGGVERDANVTVLGGARAGFGARVRRGGKPKQKRATRRAPADRVSRAPARPRPRVAPRRFGDSVRRSRRRARRVPVPRRRVSDDDADAARRVRRSARVSPRDVGGDALGEDGHGARRPPGRGERGYSRDGSVSRGELVSRLRAAEEPQGEPRRRRREAARQGRRLGRVPAHLHVLRRQVREDQARRFARVRGGAFPA